MPQTPRKDPSVQRAHEKEAKRARGALSCAECRRLKLKCDKTVPCSSCKRRGCSAICPNGSLITGQGTRFVLADTEKLHQKISLMSDRIRRLEDALSILQSTQSTETHPLLHRDLLSIKSSIELHSAAEAEAEQQLDTGNESAEDSQYIGAFGTLAIRDDGAATFFGRSAGSEILLIGELPSSSTQEPPTPSEDTPSLPSPIALLSASFPLANSILQQNVTLEHLVAGYLPPWLDACRLTILYSDQAKWFFGPVAPRQINEELLPMWYVEAPRPAPTTGALEAMSSPPMPPKGSAHDLALLFAIFAFGSLTGTTAAHPPNQEAELYIQLTKAALMIEPIMDRPPSVATVQALSLMAIYGRLCGRENNIESGWSLLGLATKLAQSIGLHRDCTRWKLSLAEVQKRRALFWELFITDCWQSLATGRIASFPLSFVDCPLPPDLDQTIADDGTVQPSYQFWKVRFAAECLSAVVQGTLTSRAPKYSNILELDRKVRDMDLPKCSQIPLSPGTGPVRTMEHFMPILLRELTLLYIHRCFFAHALLSHSLDPMKSHYAPSFLAGYRSACTITSVVKKQFGSFPEQIARVWMLWTHAFSAAVMLAFVPTHSPKSRVATAALFELKAACDLFENAATYGGSADKFLPVLKRLQKKAQETYRDTNNGTAMSPHNDIFRPSTGGDEQDELSLFGGKARTVTSKISTPLTRSPDFSPQVDCVTMNSSRAPSNSSPTSKVDPFPHADHPSFDGVHPSLLNELHGFNHHIQAQIQNAYQTNDGAFGTMMAVDAPSPGHVSPPAPAQFHAMQQTLGEERELEQEQLNMLEVEKQEMVRRENELPELETRVSENQMLEMQQQAEQARKLQFQQRDQNPLLSEQPQMQEQRQRQHLEIQDRERSFEMQQEYQRREQTRVHEQQRHYQQQQRQADVQKRYTQPQRYQPLLFDENPVTLVKPAPHGVTCLSTQPHPPPPPLSVQQPAAGTVLAHSGRVSDDDLATPTSATGLPQYPPPAALQQQQQHQAMYIMAQEYRSLPHTNGGSSVMCDAHPVAPQYACPTVYGHGHEGQMGVRQTPGTATESGYWQNAYTGVPPGHHPATQAQEQPGQAPMLQQQLYPANGVVCGTVAAEDGSLQETWQSYLFQVGLPSGDCWYPG